MKIPENVTIYDWATNIVWFDEDGIMYSMPKPNASQQPVSKEENIQQLENIKKLTGNKKVGIILTTNIKTKPPKKEDRDFIEKQLNEITKAMAIITTSPLSRMIANLFFGFKPPKFPIKFFSNEKDAKEWITKYI